MKKSSLKCALLINLEIKTKRDGLKIDREHVVTENNNKEIMKEDKIKLSGNANRVTRNVKM